MTHNELAQFAASKVGAKIVQKSICTHTIGDEDIYERQWFYVYPDGYSEEPFDLTSPDLMLKGMEVLWKERRECLLEMDGALGKGCIVFEGTTWDRQTKVHFKQPSDIPLTFWTCWYNLEKGE